MLKGVKECNHSKRSEKHTAATVLVSWFPPLSPNISKHPTSNWVVGWMIWTVISISYQLWVGKVTQWEYSVGTGDRKNKYTCAVLCWRQLQLFRRICNVSGTGGGVPLLPKRQAPCPSLLPTHSLVPDPGRRVDGGILVGKCAVCPSGWRCIPWFS